jgi:DNA-binding transcriptional ArsR family regulator
MSRRSHSGATARRSTRARGAANGAFDKSTFAQRPGRALASVAPAFFAPTFAALGDETRLLLIARLSGGRSHSISQLTKGSRLTRQAITKHLRMLEGVGIVHGVHHGRETLFRLNPKRIEETREYLDMVSKQWDEALARLKSFVEN